MGQKDIKGVGHAANTGRNAGEVIRKLHYIHEKNDGNINITINIAINL